MWMVISLLTFLWWMSLIRFFSYTLRTTTSGEYGSQSLSQSTPGNSLSWILPRTRSRRHLLFGDLRTRARKICETLLVARSWMGLKASLLQSCSMRASTTFLGHESVAKGRGQGGAPSWATVTLGDIPLSVCVCVCWARVGAVVVAEGRRSYLIPLQRDGGARALPPPCPAFPLPPDGRRATHPSERADGRGRPPLVGGNEATADDTIRRFLELEFNQSKEEKGLERCVSAKARFKCINCIVQAHVKISPRKIDLITYDPFGSATAIKL